MLPILAVVLVAPIAVSQDVPTGAKDFRVVFEEVQQGMESGSVEIFSAYFASQIQVSLKGEESGYFSSSHTYYILENFFKARKVLSFEFVNVGETEAMPYATGRAVFMNKGAREVVQVYVALTKSAGKWVISEITIY